MMKRILAGALAVLALGAAAAPAASQEGFALKGHLLWNRSHVDGTGDVPSSAGYGIGAEYVLPYGLGIGVSAYTVGRVREFNRRTVSANTVVEANYFLRSPDIAVAPYGGFHAGLGRYSRADDETPGAPKDSWRELGWQVGLRVELMPALGLDAQYRRVSTSLEDDQGAGLARQQVIVGLTLF